MNPVLDELRVQLQEAVDQWHLQLLNPKNECIQSHQGTNTIINLNLENLLAGVYLLKIQTRKSTWISRFVKI